MVVPLLITLSLLSFTPIPLANLASLLFVSLSLSTKTKTTCDRLIQFFAFSYFVYVCSDSILCGCSDRRRLQRPGQTWSEPSDEAAWCRWRSKGSSKEFINRRWSFDVIGEPLCILCCWLLSFQIMPPTLLQIVIHYVIGELKWHKVVKTKKNDLSYEWIPVTFIWFYI
jgi:hypothetical protein